MGWQCSNKKQVTCEMSPVFQEKWDLQNFQQSTDFAEHPGFSKVVCLIVIEGHGV